MKILKNIMKIKFHYQNIQKILLKIKLTIYFQKNLCQRICYLMMNLLQDPKKILKKILIL